MKKLISSIIFVIANIFLFHAPALATCGSLPYTFTNGISQLDSNTTNANNTFLRGCATNVDASQVGTLGFYASQIIPTSVATATFTGSYGYRFMSTSASQTPLQVYGAASPTSDFFDVFDNNQTTKYIYVDSTGATNATTVNATTINATTVNSATAVHTGGVTIGGTILANGSPNWLQSQSTGCGTINWNSGNSSVNGVNATGFGAYCNTSGNPLFNIDSNGNGATRGSFTVSGLQDNGNASITGSTTTANGFYTNTSGGYTSSVLTYGTGYGSYGNVQIGSYPNYPVDLVNGELLEIFSNAGTRYLALDHSGNLGINGAFYGSGAGINANSIPNTSLVTTPVTNVSGSGNISSSGGTSPTITISSSPTFTGTTSVGSASIDSIHSYSPYCGTTNFNTNTGLLVSTVTPNVLGIYCPGNSTQLLALDFGGNLGITGALHQSSERRLKDNIINFPDYKALDAIRSTRAVQYCYKIEKCKSGQELHLGFIADDTNTAIAPDHKSMDIGATAMLGVQGAAINDRRISALEKRVDDLEAQNRALYDRLRNLKVPQVLVEQPVHHGWLYSALDWIQAHV